MASQALNGYPIQLHSRDDRWIVGETQRSKILAFQMQPDRFTNIRGDFVERVAFGHHGEIQTLGDIFLLAAKNAHLNGPAFHTASLLCLDGRSNRLIDVNTT